jgi:hypothetical protein
VCEVWIQLEQLVLEDAVPLRYLQTRVVVDLGGRGRPVSTVNLAHGDYRGDSLGRPRVGGVLGGTPSVWFTLVWLTVGLVLSRPQAWNKSEEQDGAPERTIAVKRLHG